MGLQSTMTTSLTGMKAAETIIDVVGNNVANSNTVGFKQSSVKFATQFFQTQSIGSAPTGSRGGTNPRQIGLGVKVAEISPDFTQGTIEISSNPLDSAIQGDGFYVVQGNGGGNFYTRNGQFKINENNEIVSTTGQRLLGRGITADYRIKEGGALEPLRIPFGESQDAQATTTAKLAGTLHPQEDTATKPGIIKSSVLANGTIEAPDSTNLDGSDLQLVAAASTAVGVPGAGGALTPNSTYRYKIVYDNSTVPGSVNSEGAASSEFSVTLGIGQTSVAFTSNLKATPDPFDTVNIYRTEAGQTGPFKLVGSVPSNPSDPPVSFTDNVADVSLGADLNTDGVNAASYSYYVTWVNSSPSNNEVSESRPTQKISSIAPTDGGGKINLKDIPVPPLGSSFDSVRIYRNVENNSADFFEVGTFAIVKGSGTTNFIDGTSDASAISLNNKIDLDGPKANAGNALVDILRRSGNKFEQVFHEGKLSLAGSKNSRELSTQDFTITSTTTVQDLMDFMKDSLGLHQASSLIDQDSDGDSQIDNSALNSSGTIELQNGQIVVTSNLGTENSLNVNQTSFSEIPLNSTVANTIDLQFTTNQIADGGGSTTDFIVYDSLGIPVNVRVTTVKEYSTSNETVYRWYANSSDSQPANGSSTVVGNGILKFDRHGVLQLSTPPVIAIARNGIASESPLAVTLDFSGVSSLAPQSNGSEPTSTVNVTQQDGSPAGVLSSFIVTESGRIKGVFSNGTQRDLGQMILAQFNNTSGLVQAGDNLYGVGVNSGEPVFDVPGSSGLGALTSGAVELSNTDIGENLVDLILASTQYRGNARVITAAQELLDELMRL